MTTVNLFLALFWIFPLLEFSSKGSAVPHLFTATRKVRSNLPIHWDLINLIRLKAFGQNGIRQIAEDLTVSVQISMKQSQPITNNLTKTIMHESRNYLCENYLCKYENAI